MSTFFFAICEFYIACVFRNFDKFHLHSIYSAGYNGPILTNEVFPGTLPQHSFGKYSRWCISESLPTARCCVDRKILGGGVGTEHVKNLRLHITFRG